MKTNLFKSVTTSLLASVIAMSTAAAAMPAFAVGDGAGTNNHQIVIKKVPNENVVYKAYQLFKGASVEVDGTDPTQTALSNITWGDAIGESGADFIQALKGMDTYGTLFASLDEDSTADDVAIILAANRDESGFASAFADVAAEWIGENSGSEGKTGTYQNPDYVIGGLSDGYYVVLDETPESKDYNGIVPVIQIAGGDVEYSKKVEVPTSDKRIKAVDGDEETNIGKSIEGDEEDETAVAGIGSTITYEVTATLPGDYADFNGYALYFHDVLPDEVVLDTNSIHVKAGDTEQDVEATEPNGYAPYYVVVQDEDEHNHLYVYFLDLKEFNRSLTETDKVILTYDVTIKDDATAGTPIVNTANTIYPTDPKNGGWPKYVPEDPENPGEPGEPVEPGDPEYPWDDELPGEPEDPDNPEDDPKQPDNPPPKYDPEDPENPDDPEDLPYDPTTPGETPTDSTTTWVFGIDIDKTDGENALGGVGFTVKQGDQTAVFAVVDGKYKFVAFVAASDVDTLKTVWAVDEDNAALLKAIGVTADDLVTKVVTADDGKMNIDGLAPGTYTFHESTPKSGYKAVSDFDVTLVADKSGVDAYNGKLKEDTDEDDGTEVVKSGNVGDAVLGTINTPNDGVAPVVVVDPPESILPETGGAGVYFYYIAGGVLSALAIFGLVSANKKKKENA